MASYPPIRKLSQVDATQPAAGAAISDFDDALRQLKSFVKNYLAVALNDDGTVKASVTTTSALAPLSVTEPKLADNAVGALRTILNGLFTAVDAEGRAKFAAGFVSHALLADDAVEDQNLAAGAISVAKPTIIANDAIVRQHIGPAAVGVDEIENASITSAKIVSLDGAKITGYVPSTNVGLASNKIIVGDGSAHGAVATVGGALTMTLVGTEARFVLSGSSATDATYALCVEQSPAGNSLACVVGDWTVKTQRGDWTLQSGTSTMMAVSARALQFIRNGTFLIRASAPAYSCGKHKIRFSTGTTKIVDGLAACAGVGTTTYATLIGIITVTGATPSTPVSYYLEHWTELAVTNGFGFDVNTGSSEDTFHATFEAIQIA